MTTFHPRLIALLLTLLCLGRTYANSVPDATERAALEAIYTATGGPNWTDQTDWLNGNTIADIETWYGVTVAGGDVVAIDLSKNNLVGALPPELGDLAALEYLNLGNNQISSVPAEIGDLTNLVTLYLDKLQLNSVPATIGQLSNLEYLSLNDNNLSTLPGSIGNLSKVVSLHLKQNQLATLPPSTGQMSSLESLFMYRNPLTSLPEALAQAPKLRGLFLQLSSLTSLPESFSQIATLEFLNVSGALESLPSMDNMPLLRGVIVSGNQLREAPNFSNHPNKANLNYKIENNALSLSLIAQHLSGPGSATLKNFVYQPQRITDEPREVAGPVLEPFPAHPQSSYRWQEQVNDGTPPGTWQDIAGATGATYTVSSITPGELYRVIETNAWLPGMEQRTVIQPVEGGGAPVADDYNALVAIYEATNGDNWQNNTDWRVGTTADEIATWYGVTVVEGRVVALDLSQNKLNGSIPPEIAQLTALEYLNLGNNQISSLPDEMGDLTSLVTLFLNKLQLNSVPTTLGKLSNLEYLNLNENNLSTLPNSIGNLSQLLSLYLMQNQFVSLPAVIGNLTNLDGLYLYQNPLESLPPEIGNLTNLTRLFPKETNLTTLPDEITQLTQLEWVNVENSQVTSIPDLTGLPNLKGILFHNNFLTEIEDYSNHPNIVNLAVGIRNNTVDLNQVARNLSGADSHNFRRYLYEGQGSSEEVIVIEETGSVTLAPYDYVHPQSNFQWQSQPVGGTTWQDIAGATEATYTATPQGTETLYRVRLTNNWIAGQEQFSASYQMPSDYTAPTPPSIANNPPDGSTAPGVGGNRPGSRSSSNVNYVRSFTPREQYNQPSQVTMGTSVANVSVSTEYLDGLGRPIQTVVRGGAGSASQDLVQPVEYDAYGRQPKQHLPYAASGASGVSTLGAYRANGLQEQYDFFKSAPANVARSGYAYTAMKYEPSPLNRVVEQGAPGEQWRLGSGHEVTTDYLVNTAGEVLRWAASDLSGGTLGTTGSYGAGELYKTVTTDENGHRSTEYRDKLDQVVLKRVQGPDGNMDTYYVYDDYNLLRFVIPPEASERLKGSPSQAGQTGFQQQWLFRYDYDARRRMTAQQVPGGGTTTMKYDQWNRLVLSQSALQASRGEWSFTKYDQLNRPIVTGVTTSSSVSGSRFETKNSSTIGYTLSGSPHSVSEAQVRTVTYYDDYSFPHAGGGYSFQDNIAARSERTQARGQQTGSKTRNLEDNSWLNGVTYYDAQYRVIQTVSDNHLGGKDRITTTYRNAVNNDMLVLKRVHSGGGSSHTVTQNFSYDHTGRLMQVTHQWDSEPAVTLSAQQYNAIGELVKEDLGNQQQSVDYRYNIRGWLTRINDLTNTDGYFNQELSYDHGFADQQYNGNISGIRWNRAGGKAHAYGYLYDEVNRITGADYRSKPTTGNWAPSSGNYTVDQVSYDRNGNIEELKRYGEQNELLYLWDDLSYSYSGNRLQAVQDAGQAETGFVDGASMTTEYGYDASGNMTADQNKGISSIIYDPVLNLPTEVTIDGKGTIKYTYDAAGTKLRQEVIPTDGSPTKTTDYVGGFHYVDGQLDFVQHEEGRMMVKDGLAYHYDLKDHLGNTRVTFSSVPVTSSATASMEAAAAPREEQVFEGVAESRHTMAFHNTTAANATEPNPNQVAALLPGQQGPAKSLQVHPGDTVRLQVNARYETAPSQVQGLEGVATEIAGAAARSAAGLEGATASPGLNPASGAGALANSNNQAVPQGYLNYVIYDENFEPINKGYRKVSQAAAVGKANPNAKAETLGEAVQRHPVRMLGW